jgi:pimeloyl-ACP methyl ester carboxylesterase
LPASSPVLLISPDFTGHGQSRPYTKPFSPEEGGIDYELFGNDALEALDTEYRRLEISADAVPVLAAGHSMGGTAATIAALLRPGVFSAMLLYEPILMPKLDAATMQQLFPSNAMVAMTRKRRDVFPSMQVAMENFLSKPPYNKFAAQAAKAFLTGSLRPRKLEDGTVGSDEVTLCCPREFEAALYNGNEALSAYETRLASIVNEVIITSGDDSHQMDVFAQHFNLAPSRLRDEEEYPGVLTSKYYEQFLAPKFGRAR